MIVELLILAIMTAVSFAMGWIVCLAWYGLWK